MSSTHEAAAMIDPADTQTVALPLEQPKRGRGRPATGHAMTPAEKQRAYRQRLAEQKNNQVPAARLENVRSTAAERIEQLEQQLADAKAENIAAITRAEEVEANFVTLRKKLDKALATIQGMKKGNATEIEEKPRWIIEMRERGKRTWKCIDDKTLFWKRENAEACAREMSADKALNGRKYRVAQAKAPE